MNESNISSLANVSNISSANTYCKYNEPDSDVKIIVKRTVYVLLVVVGIFLNIFVIILAAKFPVRKNLHDLIINMAVSDALYLLISLLSRIGWLSHLKWSIYPSGTLGVIFCKTETLLHSTSCRVSLITLCVISIQRFKATTLQLRRARPNTLKQRIAIISVCWLIPMTISVLPTYMFTSRYGSCGIWIAEGFPNINFLILACYEVIMVILCCATFFLSILTIRRLSKPQAIQNHLSQEQQRLRAIRTQAAVRMVLASVLLYTCCWFPFFVFSVAESAHVASPSANLISTSACIDWSSLWFIVYYFLPPVNSCLSPCIYVIFLSDFREAAKKVLCRRETLNQGAPNRINPIELHPIP